MKRIGVLAVATLISTGALAGDHTINLVNRSQFIYADNKTSKSGIRNYSQFEMNYLRLKGAGKLNDVTTYNFALDALNANAATDTTDNASKFINTAYMSRKIMEGTSLIFGKQGVLIGGREYDYSGADLYSVSAFGDATPSNQIGLTLSQDFAGQNFQAQIFNGNKSRGTGADAQTRMGYAAAMYGDIMSGMIKPILGYTMIPDNTNDQTFMSAGLQFNLPAMITLEAEYSLFETENGISANNDKEVTSIIGLVRYNGENFRPFAKIILDETDVTTSTKTKRTAYDLGLEYVAAKEDTVRYHAVFSGASVKPAAGTKYSPMSIALGVKFDAPILK